MSSAPEQGESTLHDLPPKPELPMLRGDRCVLVPYGVDHVPTYHAWMQQQEMLDATASERLTLEQEYANQISWTQDPHKLTFIILDPTLPPTPTATSAGGMCGDINLFRHSYLPPHTAELEIMIAHTASQRRGIATQAIHLTMAWAAREWGVQRCVVKVGGGNERSLSLFRDKLGWTVTQYVDVFDEYEIWSHPVNEL